MRGPRQATPSESEITVAVWAWAPPGAACVTGTLTLPVAVRWGASALSPGEYAFVAPAAATPQWLYLEGSGAAAVIFAASAERQPGARRSELRIVRAGNGFQVASLELRDLDLTLHFEASKRPHAAASVAHRQIAAPASP